MTQVSKIRLNPKVEKRVFDLLSGSLVRLKTNKEIVNFLDDFLSPVEKIILAKRLSIAILLSKGNSYDEIGNILRVTPSTITKVNMRMKYGNGSVKKIADGIAISDFGKALVEEILDIFKYKRRTLTGESYRKPQIEQEKKINKLKRGI